MTARKNKVKRVNPLRIELLVGTWKQYGRGIIEGVWQYAQQHGPWLLEVEPTQADESSAIPSGMAVDGIIALVHTKEFAGKLKQYGVPVVNVSGSLLDGVTFPRVTSDAQAVARAAVAHLRDKGFRHIAFCGEPQRHFIDFWTDAYLAAMSDAKAVPLVYMPSLKLSGNANHVARMLDLQRWLVDLPKPVGVIGWCTEVCRHLAMACSLSALEIPDQVAIVGLESDDLLGRVIHPPLSRVIIPVEKIGYEAARMLDLMMTGRAAEVQDVRLAPLGVLTQQSSDVFAVEDPALKKALCFIRDHAHEGIDVRDLLRAVPMARRTMERRFKELLGHHEGAAREHGGFFTRANWSKVKST
jgi:LacI family transcriptional regulator